MAQRTPVAAAVVPAGVPLDSDPPSSARISPAMCDISITGTSTGNISAASMVCTGGSAAAVTVAVHELLTDFQPDFACVVLEDGCVIPGCLLTFCGATSAVITDSSIEGVDSMYVDAVVCVSDAAVLTLQRTNVTHNTATALVARAHARVVVAASHIAFNLGHADSGSVLADGDAASIDSAHSMLVGTATKPLTVGGVIVQHNASVTITRKSQILNNTGDAGGGVAVFDDAKLVLNGGNRVCYNTGYAGAGLTAYGRADVRITGASSVCSNTATQGQGGGVLVGDEVSLTITGGSSVCGNVAGSDGGGVAVLGRAEVTISGASNVCNNTAGNPDDGSYPIMGGGLALYGWSHYGYYQWW